MAYTSQMAAALSGATMRQLRHWRQPGNSGPVLVPELAQGRRVLYSFRDIIALRTCVYLRGHASLQKIRKALGNLRDLGEKEHLSAYALVAGAGSIQLLSEEEAVDLLDRPGQRQVLVAMGDVLEPFRVRPGVVVPALFQPRERIVIDPATRGGVPVIEGTRVPYHLVASLVEDDVPPDRIAEYYPDVTAEAARDAVDFARYVNSFDPRPARMA